MIPSWAEGCMGPLKSSKFKSIPKVHFKNQNAAAAFLLYVYLFIDTRYRSHGEAVTEKEAKLPKEAELAMYQTSHQENFITPCRQRRF